jgi:glyoxylase-like metal-dependent hydrolase (beta-lactamase superfamily II)
MNSNGWYEVIQQKDHLIVIRERLDRIEPYYLTFYDNLYLIRGNNECLLIDTGCGIFPLKPIIEKFLKGKKLIVINTHAHFDHVGGNYEFDKVYIHQSEKGVIAAPIDLKFLKEGSSIILDQCKKLNWILPPVKQVVPLRGGEVFDLGGIKVECVHSPGHSPGSISLFTDKNELFTADVAHYGTMFLPPKDNLSFFINTIKELIELSNEKGIQEIYPSHEDFNVSVELLTGLVAHLENIDKYWEDKIPNRANTSWEINAGRFKFLFRVGIKERRDFKSRLNQN